MGDDRQVDPGLLSPSTMQLTAQLDPIGPGTLLIQSWAVPGLPKSMRLETRPFGYWEIVVNMSAREVEQQLAEAGWHFCSMAPAIAASALGCGDDALDIALRRSVEQVASGTANAIELTSIINRCFLGLDHVSLSALARHIEREPVSRPSLCAVREL